jgi:intracellular septation protein
MSATDPVTKDPAPAAGAGQDTARGAGQLLVELGPVAVFMISYNVIRGFPEGHALFAAFGAGPKDAIFFATALFMAATLGAIGYTYVTQKRIPPVLMIMGFLVVVFGALTFLFRDPTFIKVKPTIVNGFYAFAIFFSLAIRQNIWKLLFKHAFSLPDRIWTALAWRWGAFFAVMAVLNEFIWRNFSEEFWVNFRFWGVFPLVFLFMLANLPITMKWIGRSNADDAQGRTNKVVQAEESAAKV